MGAVGRGLGNVRINLIIGIILYHISQGQFNQEQLVLTELLKRGSTTAIIKVLNAFGLAVSNSQYHVSIQELADIRNGKPSAATEMSLINLYFMAVQLVL